MLAHCQHGNCGLLWRIRDLSLNWSIFKQHSVLNHSNATEVLKTNNTSSYVLFLCWEYFSRNEQLKVFIWIESLLFFCHHSINVQAVYTYFYITPRLSGIQKSLSVWSSLYEMNFLDIQIHCKIDGKVRIYKGKMIGKYAGKTCPSASQVSMAATLEAIIISLAGFCLLYWDWEHHHSSLVRAVPFPHPCPKFA